MPMTSLYNPETLAAMAKDLFAEERAKTRLGGWFRIREIHMRHDADCANLPPMEKNAALLKKAVEELPPAISRHAIFAGSQSDCFARSYALINPAFEVESFGGYCDPTAVYNDIAPNDEFPAERIEQVRRYDQNSQYVQTLTETYAKAETYTKEVAFFVEQVTGHVIPDFRPALAKGVTAMLQEVEALLAAEQDAKKQGSYRAMKTALESVLILAGRYAALAEEQAEVAVGADRERLLDMARCLRKVPAEKADTLQEAIQSFLLLWQVMCMEQAPNPYAFSVGNADRIFEPYRRQEGLDREAASQLFRHFLVFFNVGDRSWAISQNVLISGCDLAGNDLTNLCSYALMDAYHDMNLPQPILSVRLHQNTPDELYQSMGRFFFTPGCLTPSLFNDDAVFRVLEASGIEQVDLPDYAVAGCQEPLIMGKDNGNTTNSWLNLGKILELTLGDGTSLLTGERIVPAKFPGHAADTLRNIRERFYANVEEYTAEMAKAANGCSTAISHWPVPFLSAFMGGMETGYDMRDTAHQGTKYNGSGCLIHGLSVVADSFAAIDQLLEERPADADRLLSALRGNFAGEEELRQYLQNAPKFGNNIPTVDSEAAEIARRVNAVVKSQRNYLGNPFRADWSTPSTHLLYGHWVAATPDGRGAREMLNYGVDPLQGDANSGLGFRLLSMFHLPYAEMNGGYASHFGVDPKFFSLPTMEEKGMQFKDRVLAPLFFNDSRGGDVGPFYLYVNITTPDTLRKVLANPQKYAPSGVYIMRIHGTFVNFLDLSPAIQQDIIMRLDLASTAV